MTAEHGPGSRPDGTGSSARQVYSRRDVLRHSAGLGAAGLAGCVRGGPSASEPHGSAEEVPTAGDVPEELEVFDTAVRSFMAENDVPGGALGVARDGGLAFARGYGFRDPGLTEQVTPDTPFRLASLSKAFTRAGIRELLAAGSLERSASAFELLGYEPLPGEEKTERLERVTVGHLLGHRGGWDREQAYDPVFAGLEVALERGWEQPPTERQLIRHMLSEPLQFAPGERSEYSNFGYLVLGHVVEAVTGLSYAEHVRREVLAPLGVTDVYPGQSLPSDRPDRETWYFDPRSCRNVVEMRPLELVRCPDGGFQQDLAVSSGGFVSTVGAFLGFTGGYWLNGRPREGEPQSWSYTGTLPGSFTIAIQHQNVDVVLFFNQRGYDPNYHRIERTLRAAVEETDNWSGPPDAG